MRQFLSAVTLLFPCYEAGLAFYLGRPGFRLVGHTRLSHGKRRVVVAPPGAEEAGLLLFRASSDEQRAAIGAQAGGRVFLFLHTEDFWRDHRRFRQAGVAFEEAPREEPYGTVAVFADPFGGRWDLIEPNGSR